MNKIKYLLIVLVAVFIYSCKEDFEDPPTPPTYNNIGPVITDGVDDTVSVLLKANEAQVWDTIKWDAAVLYAGQGLVTHYAVQIDEQGNNFASMFEIEASTSSATEIAITVGNLNAKLLKNGYNPVETYDLELRIKARVNDALDSVYSAAIPFTVTTYLDIAAPEQLYLYGNATTVGWDAANALYMHTSDGVSTVFTYLEKDMKFRFLKERDTTDNTYNANSLVNYPSNVTRAGDDMKNFVFTGASGWYKIETDYINSTLTIEDYVFGAETYTYDYDSIYIVGDYNNTDPAWDPSKASGMTKKSEGVYTIQKVLKDGAMFKFLGQRSWGDLDWGNIGGSGNTGTLGPKGFDDNITFDGGGETYNIEVNLKQGTYTIKAANIWLVGSINGWNNHGQYLAAIGNDVHVGYQYLDNSSEIKILVARDSWDGLWGAGASPGEIADGGGNIVVSGLPTYSTPGFYEIKFDMINKTVVLTKTDWGVIGDAQSGSWDTDVNLTYNQTSKVWEGQVTFLGTGSYKFRANDGWDINVGGAIYNLTNGGDNIASPAAGTYNVVLDLSGADKFYATVTAVK